MVRVPSFSVVQALTSSSAGKIFFVDDERMVARSRHGHGKTLKDSLVVVHDRAGFAVHEMGGANHAAAKGFADRLVSQADAEYRHSSRRSGGSDRC